MVFDSIRNRFLGNTDTRSAKLRKNSVTMLVVKGLSLLISLAYVPMLLKAVNRVDYGVLLTLTSIVHWVSMFDIGLGNGLRNKLSLYLAQGDTHSAREAVSSCYAALAIYVSLIALVFCIVSPFLSWQNILNAPDTEEAVLLRLAMVVFLAFCFQFVVNLITSILFSFQMPALTSLINLCSQAFTFVLVFVLIKCFGVTSIFTIGSLTCLVPPLVILVSSLILFRTKLSSVRPSMKFVRLKSVGGVLSLGVKFFVLQIITVVLFQANSLIISHVVGPEAVVEYNVAYKLIGVATVIYAIVVSPVWSATTEAYSKNDFDWIRKTVNYLRKICMAVILCGVVVVILSKFIYRVWLGQDTIDIPYSTTALIMLYVSFDMLYKIYGTVINGTGKVFAQMIITAALAICYIPLAVFLGKQWGLAGVLTANALVFAGNYIWSKLQYTKLINGSDSPFWNR